MSEITGGGVVIYDQTMSGEVVKFDLDRNAETIWATAEQMAELFEVDRSVISRHIRNIYACAELSETGTCAIFAQVRVEGGRQVKRQVKRYNLDMIISVGYRVSSAKATRFRIWANRVLKKYIVEGAAVNERRLAELPDDKLKNIEGALMMVRRLMSRAELTAGEANGVLEIIAKYAASFETLKQYERDKVVKLTRNFAQRRKLDEGEVMNLVDELRASEGETEMFGKLRQSGALDEVLAIWQGGGEGKSVPERAAYILYIVAKEQPFYDGNKRIAALFFVVFLTFNDFDLAENGETKISDRALVALTMLTAESDASEKELLIRLICRLLG